MSPVFILGAVALYFALLLGIAGWTSRRADTAGYFLGNRNSPWLVVAFGLIGDSLSGVTYISVPGQVGTAQCSYLQVVLGYVAGYGIIAEILLPLYYRLQLTSIYSYLGQRFGIGAQRTGSAFFLLSRLLGAGARLYLAANVFQAFVFDDLHVPFALTVSVIIGLILVYTLRGGKTKEQDPECQKRRVHQDHDRGEGVDVLAGIAERTAAQVLLHRVLVQPGHHHRDGRP